MFWVDILQMWNHRSQKARLVHLEIFSILGTLDWVFVFTLACGTVCMLSFFFGINGTSIIDSVMLKSGGPLRSEAGHVSSTETDTVRSFHLG